MDKAHLAEDSSANSRREYTILVYFIRARRRDLATSLGFFYAAFAATVLFIDSGFERDAIEVRYLQGNICRNDDEVVAIVTVVLALALLMTFISDNMYKFFCPSFQQFFEGFLYVLCASSFCLLFLIVSFRVQFSQIWFAVSFRMISVAISFYQRFGNHVFFLCFNL